MELPDRVAIVHGVERSDFVHPHRRHLEPSGDLVHDADAGEAVLSLSDVEERHDGALLVLRRISRHDLLDQLLALGVELEWDRRVVVGGVAVLYCNC